VNTASKLYRSDIRSIVKLHSWGYTYHYYYYNQDHDDNQDYDDYGSVYIGLNGWNGNTESTSCRDTSICYRDNKFKLQYH